MSMGKFSKLSKVKGMTNEKVLKPHYEIIFKKIMSKCNV